MESTATNAVQLFRQPFSSRDHSILSPIIDFAILCIPVHFSDER